MDWGNVVARGLERLQAGDPAAALSILEPAAKEPGSPAPVWLLLADARRSCTDEQGHEQALDRALEQDGRYVPALLAKGELLARRGDDRGAVSYLSLALSLAPPQVPPALGARLARAREMIEAAQSRFAAHLQEQLAAAGIDDNHPPRFAEALAILSGERAMQIQQPTSFFYPGLPQTAFHDNADHPWIAELEAAAPAIRAELEGMLALDGAFAPYVQGDAGRPNRGHVLLDDPRWSALYLWRNGSPVAENARRCPQTMKALEAAPIPMIRGRAPNVLFSMLRPRTHIPPHWGMINTRLICHIPLIVPDGCRLRVGNHERKVEAGKALLFDDSFQHEAWNDSDDTRIVLLFEVWNPALGAEERSRLTAMFEAINLYGEG